MDNTILNLAEQAGMRYVEGYFIFSYAELLQFIKLLEQQKCNNT